MRPGQEAPDELWPDLVAGATLLASMRPGQEAPDELLWRSICHFTFLEASMRPGQEAPDEELTPVFETISKELQ